jgi:DNA-binding GntR family transcriptional regulator
VTLLSTKADDIARLLEEEIVTGTILPGTVLRQEQLSERFDVSRTPIREALRRLAALGLVSFVPNRGVRVRTISREELREAFLVRAELEGLATALATPRMTDTDLAALRAAEVRFADLTTQMRQKAREGVDDGALAIDWMQANHAFHDVIYEAAGAPYLANIARGARRTFTAQVTWSARGELDDLYVRNERQHQAILAAISAGSPDGARAVAREHVLSSGRLLEAILDLVESRARSRA